MTKLELIKTKLAKILLQFTSIKTDKGILEYDGEELAVDVEIYIVDENGERSKPEDGEYVTEDDKTIVVTDGKVTEIKEKEEEVTEEETVEEEVTEEMEETVEEEVTEETVEEKVDELAELKAEIEALKSIVEELVNTVSAMNNTTEERLSKIEKMSASKTIEEEIELKRELKKTGNSKVDRFLERYGNC